MKKFQVDVDLKQEISSLLKKLDDIGKVNFGKKIISYKQANPIFEDIGKEVAQIFDLDWDQAREYMLDRTKLLGPSISLYKNAFIKDLKHGFWASHLLFNIPNIAINVGLQLASYHVDYFSLPILITLTYPMFYTLVYCFLLLRLRVPQEDFFFLKLLT